MRLPISIHGRLLVVLAVVVIIGFVGMVAFPDPASPVGIASGIVVAAGLLSIIGLRAYDSFSVLSNRTKHEREIRKTLCSALGQDVTVMPRLTQYTEVRQLRPGQWGWIAVRDLIVDTRDHTDIDHPHFADGTALVMARSSSLHTVLVYRQFNGDQGMHALPLYPGLRLETLCDAPDDSMVPLAGYYPFPAWAD